MLNLLQKLFNSQIYDHFFSFILRFQKLFWFYFSSLLWSENFLLRMHFSFTCTNRSKIFFAFLDFILPAFTFSFLRNEHFRFPYDFFYIFVTANIISASNSSRLHVQLGCVLFCREKFFSVLFYFASGDSHFWWPLFQIISLRFSSFQPNIFTLEPLSFLQTFRTYEYFLFKLFSSLLFFIKNTRPRTRNVSSPFKSYFMNEQRTKKTPSNAVV